MRHNPARLLLLTLIAHLMSCSTVESLNVQDQKEIAQHGNVSAAQVITLKTAANKEVTLLAELSIDDGKFRIVFLEPQLMTPVAKFEVVGTEDSVVLMGPMKDLDEDDLRAMFGGIQMFYREWFKAVKSGRLVDFHHRDKVAQFRVSEYIPAGKCAAFPKRVSVNATDEDANFAVDVLTRDLSCAVGNSKGAGL